mmetsp:Transcript_12388/g.16307  ORF Transcript_12388/g.16307 Transcript_12388/m.16307 type:complete len:145 (+) Transcript_12388:225-659(+)|eukprot:CAMPEP_0195264904 /NCGR_PEP_ID=MMETSP0706-20130129/11119_1 /TAXON_ID=33640 /ORGANISM="Asterionellopsis glacialis, Strain CCMP134" /LENGTH=144 /DNA_ID=CAMNT_0040319247 /DNA_START=204 /DNA_END=638 /DNA_ORIENTATION=-
MVSSIARVALFMFVLVSVVAASQTNVEDESPSRRRHARYIKSDIHSREKIIAEYIKSDNPPVHVEVSRDEKRVKRNPKRTQVPDGMTKQKGIRGEYAEAHYKKRHPIDSKTPFNDVVKHIRQSVTKKHRANLPKFNAAGRTAKD